MVRVFISYFLFSILICSNSISARGDELLQEKKSETQIESTASQITLPLNLTVDPDIINESKEQQNTAMKKNDHLLPDIFKNKTEKDVSIDGGILINKEAASPDSIDGARISVKVKTGQ